MADLSSVTTNFFATASETFSNNLSSSISSGATIVPVNNASAYNTGDIVVLTVDPGTSDEATFIGKKDTGNQFIDCIWTEGNTGVGHSAGAPIIDYTAATHQAALVKGIKKFANQDGSLITQAVRDALGLGTDAVGGWEPLGYTPSAITYNGNRSYTLVYAGVNLTTSISPAMKLRINKTVADNGYMGGAFNGSSHYFTKTSPSGTLGTVTNNFTIEAVVQPTSYANGGIAGRAESTLNNGFFYQMLSTGQIEVSIYSGGSANYRRATTYQSVPLNKKTQVTLTYTSTATTFVIYFDDVSVPFAVTTGGTAPTTAGTGGDFSIGRPGAYAGNYFTGYISNVAVFDAVLSAATIKDHSTRKLTGSETNCIGAWSLDNTAVNQKSPGTNDLTATGGVGYTATSPHGQLGNGVEINKAVALVMSCTYSTDTTMVVQCPEGVTIPTTGGISSVEFSTQANPYGWVSDKGRWELISTYKIDLGTSSPAVNTVYSTGPMAIVAPSSGNWQIRAKTAIQCIPGSTTNGDVSAGLTTSLGGAVMTELDTLQWYYQAVTQHMIHIYNTQKNITTASTTTYYLAYFTGIAGYTSIGTRGAAVPIVMSITPSGL